jgi:aspartate/methionine/tyrosine aminotransferase
MGIERLITSRAKRIDASGIRRVFDLGARLKDPNNLSIGQPDFPVPNAVKEAAARAIREDRNGYTQTGGIPELRSRIAAELKQDLGWDVTGPVGGSGDHAAMLVTAGTSGGLMLAFLSLLEAGDEVIVPDPYFVAYPHLATMCGATAVKCDTYPDFKLTAARVEPLLTARTKVVLVCSPGNPTGVVMSAQEQRELLELCRSRGVLLISDEIYDLFCFAESRTERDGAGIMRCPSAARVPGAHEHVLVVRGFGKTYGVTGWRMGYVAGPRALVDQIAKMQQYSYVCAPSMAQWGCVEAMDQDMSGVVRDYQARRDYVGSRLREVTEVAMPGGAFYAFPRVPERLGVTATQFVERCIEQNTLVIPGSAFSTRDTHIRLSFATARAQLERGLDVIVELMRG